jgi:transcriptional regulator with XRE-family HTH domain
MDSVTKRKLIGNRAKTARLKVDKTLLALATEIGCSEAALSRFENGLHILSADRIFKLEAILNIEIFNYEQG